MNTLKNVVFFGLLAAVLCLVYIVLNRPPEQQPLPQGLTGTTTPPTVEIPGLTGPPSPGSTPPELAAPPNFPPQPPALNAPPPGRDLGTAPPFCVQPPSTVSPMAKPWPSSSDNSTLPPPPPIPPAAAQGSIYPPGVANPLESSNNSQSTLPAPPHDPAPQAHSSISLELVMQQVKQQIAQEKYADALLNLSQLYGNPDLPTAQARQITEILDKMAAKVIYSREHLLEKNPYLVQPGDTLDIIADRYKVPALLLARINGIHDPQNLTPGRELKVMKGPFWAQISTERSEMTMMLGGSYAGRFNVVLSSDLNHAESLWTVREKSPQANATAGRLNKQWMELSCPSGQICSIHGTNDTRDTTGGQSHNAIWLSEQDMDDVFGILSVGSRVIIQR